MVRWPWKKRLEARVRERQEAEARLQQIKSEGQDLIRHKNEVSREVVLNDWTATAKRVFAGVQND